MADKFEYLNTLGISKGDMAKPANAYEEMLLELAKQLTLELRKAVESKASNTGGLASSIAALPDGKMKVSIQADYYFKFMDEGVNPTTGKVFPSPYSFKKPQVAPAHVSALQSWKGYSPQRAYASAYVTKNRYGLKPRKILDDTITQDALKKMSNDLSTLMGMTLEVVWDKNTKTWR
jgi:hypothetical protein